MTAKPPGGKGNVGFLIPLVLCRPFLCAALWVAAVSLGFMPHPVQALSPSPVSDHLLFRYLVVYLQKASGDSLYMRLPLRQGALSRLGYFQDPPADMFPPQWQLEPQQAAAPVLSKGQASALVVLLPRDPKSAPQVWFYDPHAVKGARPVASPWPPFSPRPITLASLHRWVTENLGYDGVVLDCQGAKCTAAIDTRFAFAKSQGMLLPQSRNKRFLERLSLGQKPTGGHVVEVAPPVAGSQAGLVTINVLYPPLSDKPLEGPGVKIVFDQTVTTGVPGPPGAAVKETAQAAPLPPPAPDVQAAALPSKPPEDSEKSSSNTSSPRTQTAKKSTRVVRVTKSKSTGFALTGAAGYGLLRSLGGSSQTLKGFVWSAGAQVPLGLPRGNATLLPYFKLDLYKENPVYSGANYVAFDWFQLGAGLGFRHVWNEAKTWGGFFEVAARMGFGASQLFRQVDGTLVTTALSGLFAGGTALGLAYGAPDSWQIKTGLWGSFGVFQRAVNGLPLQFRYLSVQLRVLEFCYPF